LGKIEIESEEDGEIWEGEWGAERRRKKTRVRVKPQPTRRSESQ